MLIGWKLASRNQLPTCNWRLFFFALPAGAVNQIEKQQGEQRKEQDEQEGIEIPKIGHDHITNFGDGLDWGKYVLIGETVNYSANKKTEKTRNNVIQLPFAATGGASTRSVSGQSHSYPKDQPADDIADDIRGWNRRKDNQSQAAQAIQTNHRNHQGGHHELQNCQIGEAENAHDLVVLNELIIGFPTPILTIIVVDIRTYSTCTYEN